MIQVLLGVAPPYLKVSCYESIVDLIVIATAHQIHTFTICNSSFNVFVELLRKQQLAFTYTGMDRSIAKGAPM